MLTPADFFVLHGPFTEEACLLFPLPVEAALYSSDDKELLWPLLDPEPEEEASALPYPSKEQTRVIDNNLIIPIPWDQIPKMALVLRVADPFLLKKFSPSWQKEFQHKLLPRWTRLQPLYIDPSTDLYNQRAAAAFFQAPRLPPGFFFLVHVVFYKSGAASTLQKLRELADLLQCFNLGPCFSFGYGVFALFLPTKSREKALSTAHFLQKQLKRERMHKVQIAFVPTESSQSTALGLILERSWQALSIAEKRGPFGIYDIERPGQGHRIPFQLRGPELAKNMQTAWRKQGRFTLAAISCQQEFGLMPDLDSFFSQGKVYHSQRQDPAFILLAGIDPNEAARYIKDVWAKLCAAQGSESLTIGIASWPCLDFKK